MITLAWPWLLLALPLPWLVRLLLPPAPPRLGPALRLPSLDGLGALAAKPPVRRWRLAIAALIWVLLLLAAARPQTAGAPLPLPVLGRDIMLALDISGSMQQQDFTLAGQPVSRLALVKAAAASFVARRDQDRLGLILFGTRAHVLTPLTYDHTALGQMLDEAIVGLAGSETAIGDAIGLAVKRLDAAPSGQRVLLLFTDGANNAGALDPRTAARLAAAAGVRIHTIGLSTATGGTTDDLDPATLRAVAEQTGGRFFRATDAGELAQVARLLDALEPEVRAERTYRPVQERYPWPAAGALLLATGLVLTPLVRASRIRAPLVAACRAQSPPPTAPMPATGPSSRTNAAPQVAHVAHTD